MARAVKRKPRKPSTAPVTLAPETAWDKGAMGAANRIGLVEEDAGQFNPETGKVENPNGVRRVRRIDMLEEWHGNYIKQNGRPFITTTQYNAADALQSAFARTMMGPGVDLAQERVDSSPKPDHAVTIQIDRISRFHRIARLVPRDDQGIINWCVLGARTPIDYRLKDGSRPYNGKGYAEGMRVLRDALERLARQMGN